ncbi:caspase family protein [Pseudomonas putida]|uniref:caspase family protein n=1 Tax=Pseudomonas putida TaxID=303 RepID=UPI002364758B|nr:caspase family protein [Pseudomonas putida]MDD2067831.1 caspase family protein [Pseudomonas putida]HDS1738284.1 caspase family protein [Pseudomonas putida]
MKRVALVVGNAAYPENRLTNPCNDAEDVACALRQFEFHVIECRNASYETMVRALLEFRAEMHLAEVGLFFFAGHGLQIDGKNFLLATDTKMGDPTDAQFSAMELDQVMLTMERANTTTNLIILDACRNNPWAGHWHRSVGSDGLAYVDVPRGTLIAFSTSPGQTAADGVGQRNGKYTSALLKHIGTPDCTIEAMFKRVRNTLRVETNGKQISWEHTSLASDFFFNRSIGARIDRYDEQALKDGVLVLDDSHPAHQIIRSLKVATFHIQNGAVLRLAPETAQGFSTNDLFLIGRNVYQAACGNARTAILFISDFPEKTKGLPDDKRRALLDGMLFEVFFDKHGKLRKVIKDRRFPELFDLQRFESTASSFDFIGECLLPYANRFHVLPGKTSEVAVDVVLEARDRPDCAYITRICIASGNLLRAEDEEIEPGEPMHYIPYSIDVFERYISVQLLIPQHLLSFTYSGLPRPPGSVNVPAKWTVRKEIV